MPIKFRCAYCNQLMGIGRRKAGAVVSCPTCHGQVIVPSLTPPDAQSEGQGRPNSPKPNLFEGKDFDPALLDPKSQPGPATPIRPAALPTADLGDYDAQPVALPSPIFERGPLPETETAARRRAFMLVLILVLLGIGFGVGFAVARMMN